MSNTLKLLAAFSKSVEPIDSNVIEITCAIMKIAMVPINPALPTTQPKCMYMITPRMASN